MAKTITAERALDQVTTSAEKIKNDETQHFPEAASPGDCVRQGDIYIVLLNSVPKGAKRAPFQEQLAPGTTKGSRHCLDSSSGVQLWRIEDSGALDGPVLELLEKRTITHPEHGHWVLPVGVYKIEYQRDLADEEKRVLD